ncbi:vWA domain-containing protein [Marinoscillum furvescens]|uniref:von Willebrand factor type A domain-containing protein n=1 Tax=Marinoscillum furvescens DSM 4134 TaxID=1122208 RepID=A0A3D9L5P6_MARFU|nr:VWA domain-containing protein [Marinoscillum furvescens]REE01498.1 von Willebrand factor type A domain-containing protein [Marinoscillum furvescens DSM 4134]
MIGYRFTEFIPEKDSQKSTFDNLMNVFMQLMVITSGDVSEALSWLTNLDRQYNISNDEYGIGDFIEDLKAKGYIAEETPGGEFKLTAKSEQAIRKSALEEIFGKLRKGGKGDHRTQHSGRGDELSSDFREFQFGDSPEQIELTESIKNAQINHGFGDFTLTENDLEVREREYKTQTSTVLMIDISHSMILYGEDRITPAKKVAMALAELVTKKYPKDTLDVIVFGNDAWQIQIKDLPYLNVGPYHTNTVAGLELAMDLLRRRKNKNKQIFMITDGKPTCLKEGIRYYKNSFGLDPKILNKTLNLAAQCKRLNIPITTFMIASDPYLKQFVQEFTEVNSGNAYYSSLQGLGHMIFEDYRRNRRKNL